MQYPRYSQINPWAFAIAAGSAALIVVLFIGFPMLGMAGGGYGGMMGGGSMGPYMNGHAWGGSGAWPLVGIVWLIGAAICAAIVGAIAASIYNAVNARGAANANEPPPSSTVQSATIKKENP